ncbi:MAG: hypothetical protein HY057_08455 [Rhodospirillales bacterium]|nr:hypothetical protein [Rhodospirillales bacterium]
MSRIEALVIAIGLLIIGIAAARADAVALRAVDQRNATQVERGWLD